jgi:hypothetical protein
MQLRSLFMAMISFTEQACWVLFGGCLMRIPCDGTNFEPDGSG